MTPLESPKKICLQLLSAVCHSVLRINFFPVHAKHICYHHIRNKHNYIEYYPYQFNGVNKALRLNEMHHYMYYGKSKIICINSCSRTSGLLVVFINMFTNV